VLRHQQFSEEKKQSVLLFAAVMCFALAFASLLQLLLLLQDPKEPPSTLMTALPQHGASADERVYARVAK
jgi:hypothetical protein